MKRIVTILVVGLAAHIVAAAEAVSVPWSEFKALYVESIERRVMESLARPEDEVPRVHSIEEAVYSLQISEGQVRGEALISGRVVSGEAEAIGLFGKDIVIAQTRLVSGGSLFVEQGCDGGIALLPGGETQDFQIVLSFLALAREDSASRVVTFSIPFALKNSLNLVLDDTLSLVEEPGIADTNGVYHFSPAKTLSVRYRDKNSVTAEPIAIDTFSRVRLQGKCATISTVLATTQPWPGSFVLHGGNGTRYVGSTLRNSWITPLAGDSYEIRIPSDCGNAFSIQLAADPSDRPDAYQFRLPTIEGNNGREGDFVLEEPDDGSIRLEGKGLVEGLPVARLGEAMAREAGDTRFYLHLPGAELLSLDVQRFQSVATPDTVLDTQRFFIAFEENGNVLSVLSMDLPAEIGPRMEVKAVPDTEIWSLVVNGRKRKVYTNDAGMWIIPLEAGIASHVELALLRKGEALGLHGRLEAAIPATGLPSRTVEVGIALPQRVQLLSLEGPLSPAPGDLPGAPLEFVGQPYHFSRSFYKGQGMGFALAYKEPVKQAQK